MDFVSSRSFDTLPSCIPTYFFTCLLIYLLYSSVNLVVHEKFWSAKGSFGGPPRPLVYDTWTHRMTLPMSNHLVFFRRGCVCHERPLLWLFDFLPILSSFRGFLPGRPIFRSVLQKPSGRVERFYQEYDSVFLRWLRRGTEYVEVSGLSLVRWLGNHDSLGRYLLPCRPRRPYRG